jgi:microsomal dipeptidase-like Zn-dependent dipeptidase
MLELEVILMVLLGNSGNFFSEKSLFISYIFRVPYGLSDVSYYPDLFALLAEDPIWTEENLRKLASENFIRVFTEAERVRH